MFLKTILKFFIPMSYCFAVSTSQSQDDFQGKALQIKRGFMVGLHFLKQRDVPTWVKNAQLHKQGDLNSSFEELGNMIGEIVACKMTGTTEPVLNYPEHSITSAANWNYVFVKSLSFLVTKNLICLKLKILVYMTMLKRY